MATESETPNTKRGADSSDAHDWRALISSDPLLEKGRTARRPLEDWAGALLAGLGEVSQTAPQGWKVIAEAMNNAALIEVFRGRYESAEKLCWLQLEWIADLRRRLGNEQTLVLALQPWINLGRLKRILGAHADSLAHFSLIQCARNGQRIALGPVEMKSALWKGWLQDPVSLAALVMVYVLDSMKSLIAAGRYDEAISLIRAERQRDGWAYLPCTEAELIALSRANRIEEARKLTGESGWSSNGYDRMRRPRRASS